MPSAGVELSAPYWTSKDTEKPPATKSGTLKSAVPPL